MRRFAAGLSSSDKAKLSLLADQDTRPAQYRELMYKLGETLGQRIAKSALRKSNALLVCTAEDADYLASGIVRALAPSVPDLKLACFWNFRTRPKVAKKLPLDLDVAPIVKRYEEPTPRSLDFVVVAKSVISTACVVRHNLLNLLQRKRPAQIFIAAPVMYKGADLSLRDDFPNAVSQKFRFVYFAVDDDRDEQGLLIPGIGGDVYKRLGVSGMHGQILVPEIVKRRRTSYLTLKSSRAEVEHNLETKKRQFIARLRGRATGQNTSSAKKKASA